MITCRCGTRKALVAAACAIVACDGTIVGSYSSEQDDVAMAAIASEWREAGGLTIQLCEDVARSLSWTGSDGCVVDHLVRGDGQGLTHTERHDDGAGCATGGCTYEVVAWVRGMASGAGLSGQVPVSGEVRLQSAFESDPYAFPYTLSLECDPPVEECAITGILDAAGGVAATLVLGPTGPGQSETQHALARMGAAACP